MFKQRRALAVACCGLAVFLSRTAAAQTISPPTTDRALRGASIDIAVNPMLDGNVAVGMGRLTPGAPVPVCADVAGDVQATKGTSTVTFVVPLTVPAGHYLLCLARDSERFPVPSRGRPFEVINNSTVTVSDVQPSVAYPSARPETYRLFLQGTNFSAVPAENFLLLNGRRFEPDCGSKCSTSYLTFAIPRAAPGGQQSGDIVGALEFPLYVERGGQSEPFTVSFALIPAALTKIYAGGITIVIVGIVVALIAAGLRASGNPATGRNVIKALLLDSNNQSYSLAKFQFLLWTFAAIGGYLYLSLAWSLLRGRIDLAPVPEGLPGIIGISAVTAITAVAASEARSKGSGLRPSWGDFVMTGGRVAAERVQFFTWTLVSVLVFIVAVAMSNPGVIETLPRIPEGLLFLMGISAAGYLGGKFVRQPAPEIKEVPAEVKGELLVLNLQGRHLSGDLRVLIDFVNVTREGPATPPGIPTVKVEPREPDPESTQPNFYKTIDLTVTNPDPSWKKGQHRIDVINPDGQSASKLFEPNKVPILFT